MKIKRLVGLLADLSPHAYSDSVVLLWLSQCENSILTDVFLVAPEETVEYEAVTEQALLVPHPYDKLYLPYLQAQVAHANQEYDLYANLMALYNAYRYEYAQYIVHGADPGSGDAIAHGYYLSAYGIATAHGYAGTEEEWVRSLQGATGKDGQSAYELAVEQGFVGSEEEWIRSLHGADGVGRSEVIAKTENGASYTADVVNFAPEIGMEILLIPQNTNQGAATLSINGGEAYPLCLRPGWNVTGNDLRPQLTLPVEAGMLLRGAEYVFRFDGTAWILQSHIAQKNGGTVAVDGLTTPVSPMDIEGANWRNWFDYNDFISNYESSTYIDPKTGKTEPLNGYYAFPPIYLKGGKTYTMSGSMRICVLYNAENDSYISTVVNNNATKNPVTFSVDAAYSKAYIRFCHTNTTYITDQFMIVEGDTLPDSFIPHEATLDWLSIVGKAVDGTQLVDGTVTGGKLKDNSVGGQKLKDGSIDVTKSAAYSGAVNLYNSKLADPSLWHDTSGTGESTQTSYFASHRIKIEPSKTYNVYAMNAAGTVYAPYAVYEITGDGTYVKLTPTVETTSGAAIAFTVSENAAYLVFNGRNTYLNMFVVSEKYLPYVPPYAAQIANTQNLIQGHWAGGLLVALGDSITRGCSNGETLEDGTVLANGGQIPKPYANYAAELLGMCCKNFGVDGATVKTVLARITDTKYMAGLKTQPDIITVKIGTNDMAQVTLGTIDDVYDAANVTYYSGLKEIARLLSEGYPDSTIVFITPLRAHDNARNYVKAMEEVAELYDIPCMPMHRVLRYMQKNAEGSFYINNHYNGLHPNQAAHLRMGRALAGFLQTV